MTVLHLRRDMVVADEPVVEIDRPLPLRTIEASATPVLEEDDDHPHENDDGRSLGEHVSFWLKTTAVLAALSVYPTFIVMASDVGDRDVASHVDRTQWAAPWAGAAAGLLEKHFDRLGWAADASAWAPMARLTAKPAYQSAMAGAVGEFITLAANRASETGHPDPDLSAAPRLVHTGSTGVQLRAARDALVNFDRTERRQDRQPTPSSAPQARDQLDLIIGWADASARQIQQAADLPSGPIDTVATVAVYAAKGRAQAAYVFLETMEWPREAAAVTARTKALAAWKAAAEFHPLIVLAGSPEGSILGNHAVSMGYLIEQARSATAAYAALLQPSAPASAPETASTAAPAPAGGLD